MALLVCENRPPSIRRAVGDHLVVIDRSVDQIVEKLALCAKIGIGSGEPYWVNCDGVFLLVECENVISRRLCVATGIKDRRDVLDTPA